MTKNSSVVGPASAPPPVKPALAPSLPGATFASFSLHRRLTSELAGPERRAHFEHLPSSQQEEAWVVLREQVEARRLVDEFVTDPPAVEAPAAPRRAQTAFRNGRHVTDDVLLRVPPPDYVSSLSGQEVTEGGGSIHCPLPGHEDRTPSFQVWPGADRGVWCFGCQRGGDIYAFAAALWGLQLRGLDFILLRRQIAAVLLECGAS